jgi:penicillin-binding protein 2
MHKFKNVRQEHGLYKRRILAIFVGIAILTFVLLGRLIYLQIWQHKLYTTLARQNQLGLVPIEPNRGLIYDRNGVLLAENKPVFNLVVTPDLVRNLPKTIAELSKILKIDAEDLKQFERQRRIHHRFEPVPLRLRLNEEEVAKFSIERYHFPGVSIQAQMIRYYPRGEPFAAIVGYMGRINENELQTIDPVNYSASNFIGKTGVEKNYEAQLHGTVGYQQIETNVHGQIVRTLKQTQPIAGRNLTLTIDSSLQELAQQSLGRQKGAIIALDPSNGEILAFVSSPSYDPNLFVSGIKQKDYEDLKKAEGTPLYNRALRGGYHPGSTIKPFISIGALMENVVTPSFTIHDAGEFQINGRGRIYHNFRQHSYGDVNLLKALTVSSDIYFYNLSMLMGINRIYSSLQRFGFGEPIGIDLPDEGSGTLPNPQWKLKAYGQSWYPGDTLNCGIGQGYLLVTPLQLAFAVSTVADWGERWQPHVLLNWRSADGSITPVEPKRLPPVDVPQPILSFIRLAMQHVINGSGGTAARYFYGAPYTVAGKTGTAQVFSLKDNEYYDKQTISAKLRDNSLFIAFAPIEHPKIALAIIVQNSVIPAGLIARKLLDHYLIPPSPIPIITSQDIIPKASSDSPTEEQGDADQDDLPSITSEEQENKFDDLILGKDKNQTGNLFDEQNDETEAARLDNPENGEDEG